MSDTNSKAPSSGVEDAIAYERFRWLAILDKLPVGVVTTEIPSGRILYFNEEAENILRHPLIPADSSEDYSKYGGIHEDGTPYTEQDYPNYRAVHFGETVRDRIVRYRRGDDTITYLKVCSTPIKDRDGTARLTVCSFHDLGTEKSLESELLAKIEQLEVKVRELSE